MIQKAAPTFSSGSFSAGTGGAITATSAGANVNIQSAAYSPSGKVKVSGGTDAQATDWEAGFIQTITASEIKAHYAGSKTQKLWTVTVACPKRDALAVGGAPWYDPNNVNGPGRVAFSKTKSSVSVLLWDRPQLPTPWTTPDGKGKLSSTSGKDVFTAWMIARKKTDPKTIKYVKWTSWEMDYGATFNYASTGAKTVDKITGKTKNNGSGDGRGGTTPTLSGTIANNAINAAWS